MRKLTGKPEINYPCQWQYILIGSDETAMRETVTEVVGDQEHTLALSKNSATGKYCSLALALTVHHEAHRLETYHALLKHASIKMIL